MNRRIVGGNDEEGHRLSRGRHFRVGVLIPWDRYAVHCGGIVASPSVSHENVECCESGCREFVTVGEDLEHIPRVQV